MSKPPLEKGGNSPNCVPDLVHSGHAFCCNLCSKLFALAAEFDTPKTIIEKYFCNSSVANCMVKGAGKGLCRGLVFDPAADW